MQKQQHTTTPVSSTAVVPISYQKIANYPSGVSVLALSLRTMALVEFDVCDVFYDAHVFFETTTPTGIGSSLPLPLPISRFLSKFASIHMNGFDILSPSSQASCLRYFPSTSETFQNASSKMRFLSSSSSDDALSFLRSPALHPSTVLVVLRLPFRVAVEFVTFASNLANHDDDGTLSSIIVESILYPSVVEYVHSAWPISRKHVLLVPGPTPCDFVSIRRVPCPSPLDLRHLHLALTTTNNPSSISPTTWPFLVTQQFPTLSVVEAFILASMVPAMAITTALRHLAPSSDGGHHQVVVPVTRISENAVTCWFQHQGYHFYKRYTTAATTTETASPSFSLSPGQLFGGTTLDPVGPGIVHSCVAVFDMNALYPSLVIEFGLCFTTVTIPPDFGTTTDILARLGNDDMDDSYHISIGAKKRKDTTSVIPKLLEHLVSNRTEFSDMVSKTNLHSQYSKYASDSGKVNNFIKTVTNAIVGNFGNPRSLYYCPILSQLVTWNGRNLFRHLVACGNQHGRVIYGDTDSVFVALHQPQQQRPGYLTPACILDAAEKTQKSIESKLHKSYGYTPGIIRLKLENVFYRVLFAGKKRYFGNCIKRSHSWSDHHSKLTLNVPALEKLLSQDSSIYFPVISGNLKIPPPPASSLFFQHAPDVVKGMESIRSDLSPGIRNALAHFYLVLLECTSIVPFAGASSYLGQLESPIDSANASLFRPRVCDMNMALGILSAINYHYFQYPAAAAAAAEDSAITTSKLQIQQNLLHPMSALQLQQQQHKRKFSAISTSSSSSSSHHCFMSSESGSFEDAPTLPIVSLLPMDFSYYKIRVLYPPVQRVFRLALDASTSRASGAGDDDFMNKLRRLFNVHQTNPTLSTKIDGGDHVMVDASTMPMTHHQDFDPSSMDESDILGYFDRNFSVLSAPTRMSDELISVLIRNVFAGNSSGGVLPFPSKTNSPQRYLCTNCGLCGLSPNRVKVSFEDIQSKPVLVCPGCDSKNTILSETSTQPYELVFIIHALAQQASEYQNQAARMLFKRCRSLLFMQVDCDKLFGVLKQ